MMLTRPIGLLFIALVAAGCITVNMNGDNSPPPKPSTSPIRREKPSTPATVNGRTISIEMSDEEIFAAFGLDATKDDVKLSKGPDGYSASYQKEEQFVSITRSVVTGTVVYAHGPIAGEWQLGGGLQ